MDLNEFNGSFNWAGSFDSGMGAVYEACQEPDPLPGYKGPIAWTKDDVAEVLCASEGENDGANWLALLRLKDGRFVFLSAGCDYTGWDCQASGRSTVAKDKKRLIQLGMDADDRSRLGL